jgi:hypothetical protein
MKATLVQATMTCDKDYMDTRVGIDAMKFAHECDDILGMPKIHSIMRQAIREWEGIAREKGKHEACALIDTYIKSIEEAVKN